MIPQHSRLDSLVERPISPAPRRSRPENVVRGPTSPESDALPRRSRLDSFASGKRSGDSPPSSYAPSSYISADDAQEEHIYPHISVFRTSTRMEVHVQSPSVKMTRPPGHELPRPVPVFDTHNKIHGIILLDAGLWSSSGRLTVSLEGAFVYIAPPPAGSGMPNTTGPSAMHRHVFLLETYVLPRDKVIPSRRSNSSLREALANVRPRRERRPSQASVRGTQRPFPFSFGVSPPSRHGEELPPTFCSVMDGFTGTRGRAFVERAEIMYKIVATWESDTGADQTCVEAPIIFEADTDFESLDGRSLEPESWLEIPLRSERPIPFTCAVAVPDAPSLPRSSSISYYVVFTTKPRSPTLAREIVLDATIAVSLVRQVSMDAPPVSPSSASLASPASTASSSSSTFSDDATSFILSHKAKLMKRMVHSAPPILSRKQLKPLPQVNVDKPLPEITPEGYSETRTLYTDVYAGFPKRPRPRVGPGQTHPSLAAHTLLPDGLYKAKMQLHKNMIPSVDWGDLSIKYFLEVSVLFGQDESRARVPILIS